MATGRPPRTPLRSSAPAPPIRVQTLLIALLAVALLSACQRGAEEPGRDAAQTETTAPTAEPLGRSTIPDGPPPAPVEELLAEVSEERLRQTVDRLAAFGTRHTLSETASETRGIGAARRWIHDELTSYGESTRLEASFDRHVQPPDGRRIPEETEIVNVVATLPGTSPEARSRRYYVIGHYDSRASDVMDAEIDAPGANDDASGVALLMELARVMAQTPLDATVVFMATAGEEQGLYGASLHAKVAREEGLDIRAVLSNDVVGDPSAPLGEARWDAVRVFSPALPAEPSPEELRRIRALGAEIDSPSRQLARYIHEVAAWHGTRIQPMLIFRADRFLRGGDHTAFTRLGFPAVRFTEVHENYARQHQDVRIEGGVQYGDLPRFVEPEYLAEVTRLNGAALAHLASAPSTPEDVRIIVATLANDTTLRWSPSPEPDTEGYEVVWRKTSAPFWEKARDVGNVTEATLPLSKDNHYFGVRAYDGDGFRSPVAFAGAARE